MKKILTDAERPKRPDRRPRAQELAGSVKRLEKLREEARAEANAITEQAEKLRRLLPVLRPRSQ